jgi:hypothetical protein
MTDPQLMNTGADPGESVLGPSERLIQSASARIRILKEVLRDPKYAGEDPQRRAATFAYSGRVRQLDDSFWLDVSIHWSEKFDWELFTSLGIAVGLWRELLGRPAPQCAVSEASDIEEYARLEQGLARFDEFLLALAQSYDEYWAAYVYVFDSFCQLIPFRMHEMVHGDSVRSLPRSEWSSRGKNRILRVCHEQLLDCGIVAQ